MNVIRQRTKGSSSHCSKNSDSDDDMDEIETAGLLPGSDPGNVPSSSGLTIPMGGSTDVSEVRRSGGLWAFCDRVVTHPVATNRFTQIFGINIVVHNAIPLFEKAGIVIIISLLTKAQLEATEKKIEGLATQLEGLATIKAQLDELLKRDFLTTASYNTDEFKAAVHKARPHLNMPTPAGLENSST
jgi:hypothetical protein